jgi:hypothetical protein
MTSADTFFYPTIVNYNASAVGKYLERHKKPTYVHSAKKCSGGVAQSTSHPPKGTEDPGSIPARI